MIGKLFLRCGVRVVHCRAFFFVGLIMIFQQFTGLAAPRLQIAPYTRIDKKKSKPEKCQFFFAYRFILTLSFESQCSNLCPKSILPSILYMNPSWGVLPPTTLKTKEQMKKARATENKSTTNMNFIR